MTFAVAAALALAALLSSAAADAWQQGLRNEIKRSAALVEDVRAVYGDEAPLALELALAKARAAELPPAAAVAERKAIFAIEQAVGGDHLIGDRYARSVGYDIGRRLADVRARRPNLLALDPDAALARGDRLSRWALLVMFSTAPLVLGFLIADVARRRMKPAPASAKRDSDELNLVPRPWSAPEPRRFGAFVALAAWLVVTLVPSLQLFFVNQEQRAQSLAARTASEVSSQLQAGGVVFSATTAGQQRVRWLGMHATGQALAANIASSNNDSTALVSALSDDARVEASVVAPAERIVETMHALPAAADGVDADTRRAVAANTTTADAKRREQNAEADHANRAGARSNRVTVAILLGGLAASLAALGAVARSRRPSLLDLGGAGVLGMSLIALASVPLL